MTSHCSKNVVYSADRKNQRRANRVNPYRTGSLQKA